MARNNSNNRGTSNRGGNSRGGNSRSRNNNPEGKNQYSSDWGVLDLARERPLTATAVAAGAAAVGLFAWSRRAQISDQLSGLSSQIGEWSQSMGWSGDSEDSFDDTAGLTTATATDSASTSSAGKSRRGRKSQADISAEALTLKETGKAQQPEAIG